MSSNEQLNAILAKMEEESEAHKLNKILEQVRWIEVNVPFVRYQFEFHKMIYDDYVEVIRKLVESKEILNPSRELQDWDLFHNTRYYDSVRGTCNELYTVIKFNNKSWTTQCYVSLEGKKAQVRGEDLLVFKPGWDRPYTVQVKTGVKDAFGFIKVYTDWLSYETLDRLAISNYEQQFCFMVDYPKFKRFIESNYQSVGDVTSKFYMVAIKDIRDNGNEFNFMDLS